MAASAEYELEKRVERLELFPVELEKGKRLHWAHRALPCTLSSSEDLLGPPHPISTHSHWCSPAQPQHRAATCPAAVPLPLCCGDSDRHNQAPSGAAWKDKHSSYPLMSHKGYLTTADQTGAGSSGKGHSHWLSRGVWGTGGVCGRAGRPREGHGLLF